MGGKEFLKAKLRTGAQPLVIRQVIMVRTVKTLKLMMWTKELIFICSP